MIARVCSRPGCPHITPCPDHPPRARNASWSTNRDREKQRAFRNAVLARDNFTCTRCGHHDPTGRTLQAHHLRPGYSAADGVAVCTSAANGCHAQIDRNAR